MAVFSKIMLALLLIAELVTVSTFIKIGWPKHSKKSTILKCTGSLFFILTAVFSCQLGAGFTIVSVLMIIGFISSLFGDFILDQDLTDKNILIGIIFFFIAHLFYLVAFINVGKKLGNDKAFVWQEFVAIIAIVAVAGVSSFILKMDMRTLFVPVACYSLVISFMVVKAVTTSIYLYKANGLAAALPLCVGAALFITSDMILSMMYFANKNTKNMRMWNLITYFAGQMLMAYSLISIA